MRLRLRLERAAMLSPAVRSLVFEVSAARKGEGTFSYEPGHYLDLFVPTSTGLAAKRSYSIASAPGAAGPSHVELAISRVDGGPASTALHALDVGSTLDAEGPRGSFLRWPAERDVPTLFVATGSSGVSSVKFSLNGSSSTDNSVRYELDDKAVYAGTYTLTATPYSADNAQGNKGSTRTYKFTVRNSPKATAPSNPSTPSKPSTPPQSSAKPAVTKFTLVNANTGKAVAGYASMDNGDVIDLGALETARGPEMYLTLWIRTALALGGSDFNIKVVRGPSLRG